MRPKTCFRHRGSIFKQNMQDEVRPPLPPRDQFETESSKHWHLFIHLHLTANTAEGITRALDMEKSIVLLLNTMQFFFLSFF